MKILAEGDSWFKYPGLFTRSNIIEHLPKRWDVTDLSSNGDEAGAMLTGNQNKKMIKKLREEFFDCLLFSGGGNDIVGEFDLRLYLKNGRLNTDMFQNKLTLLKCAYRELNERVNKYSQNKHIPIITHTYDLPVKLGEPFKFLGITLAGPWIKPFMIREGVTDKETQIKIMQRMLEMYRDMLLEVSDEYPNFHVVDTQGLVSSNEWADELHPNSKGFRKVAERIKMKVVEVV